MALKLFAAAAAASATAAAAAAAEIHIVLIGVCGANEPVPALQ
jgi:hypothetical protein